MVYLLPVLQYVWALTLFRFVRNVGNCLLQHSWKYWALRNSCLVPVSTTDDMGSANGIRGSRDPALKNLNSSHTSSVGPGPDFFPKGPPPIVTSTASPKRRVLHSARSFLFNQMFIPTQRSLVFVSFLDLAFLCDSGVGSPSREEGGVPLATNRLSPGFIRAEKLGLLESGQCRANL